MYIKTVEIGRTIFIRFLSVVKVFQLAAQNIALGLPARKDVHSQLKYRHNVRLSSIVVAAVDSASV